jgi:hypothetical protein
MFVCWADKTSNLHLFLLPKSSAHTVSFVFFGIKTSLLSKTFLRLLSLGKEYSAFSLCHCSISYSFPSLSLCLLGDYYSTKKKIEYIETRQVTTSDDGKLQDFSSHVDVRVSMRLCKSVRVLSRLFNIYN